MISFLLVFILGFLFVNLISINFSTFEKIGFAFPIGLGFVSFIFFIFQIISIKIDIISTMLGVVFFSICIYVWLKHKNQHSKMLEFNIGNAIKLTFSWFLCLIVMLYFLGGIGAKNFYYTPLEYDSIVGYDLLAKTIAKEGKTLTSFFDYPYQNTIDILRFVYPPYVSSSFAFAYLSDFQNPKIITFLLFISFLISFYGLIRSKINDTWAIFFTLVMMLTPEFFSHASLALSNLPNGILTSLSALCLVLYLTERTLKYFYISLVFMVLSNWTRSDSIVFVLGAAILFVLDFYKTKEWRLPLLYIVVSVLPLIIWSIFIQLNLHIKTSEIFVNNFFWNSEKLTSLFSKTSYLLLASGMTYGITFQLFLVILALNFVDLFTTQIHLAIFIVVSWFAYTLLYYQMDNAAIGDLETYIYTGFKRGMFNFVPLCWFFIATSPFSEKWIKKMDSFIYK